MQTEAVSKTVNSQSLDAMNYDFSSGDVFMKGDVKFVWDEYVCPKCHYKISAEAYAKTQRESNSKPASGLLASPVIRWMISRLFIVPLAGVVCFMAINPARYFYGIPTKAIAYVLFTISMILLIIGGRFR